MTNKAEDKNDVLVSIQALPALIDVSENAEIIKVSCGSRHTAAITSERPHLLSIVKHQQFKLFTTNFILLGSGDLYTWGWGKMFYFIS